MVKSKCKHDSKKAELRIHYTKNSINYTYTQGNKCLKEEEKKKTINLKKTRLKNQ